MSESSSSVTVPGGQMRQELSMTPVQAVPSLTRRQFCSTCMWQAELPTVSDAADNDKDIRSILVI